MAKNCHLGTLMLRIWFEWRTTLLESLASISTSDGPRRLRFLSRLPLQFHGKKPGHLIERRPEITYFTVRISQIYSPLELIFSCPLNVLNSRLTKSCTLIFNGMKSPLKNKHTVSENSCFFPWMLQFVKTDK